MRLSKPHSFLVPLLRASVGDDSDDPCWAAWAWTLNIQIAMEFLLQIFSYIDLPSQACFAMSSKALYESFGWVLQADDLRRLSSLKHGKYNQTRGYQLRVQLLTQFEGSRWACCAMQKAASTWGIWNTNLCTLTPLPSQDEDRVIHGLALLIFVRVLHWHCAIGSILWSISWEQQVVKEG